MKISTFITAGLLAALTLCGDSVFAQSKEQREAARQWPVTLRVKPGKVDSKQSKVATNQGLWGGEQITTEKIYRWTADVDIRQTNLPQKVELRAFYVGEHDEELAVIGKDVFPVEFNEKGHCSVEITSPTAKLTKTKRNRRFNNPNGPKEKESQGDRIEGLAAQLVVDGTIVKTFVSKPIWVKGAWEESPDEDSFNPMVKKAK